MRLIEVLLVSALLSLPVAGFAEGDPEKGKKVFRKCRACHDVGPEAKNKSGPALTAILGTVAGGADGFKYSNALKDAAAEGLVWDKDTLAAFLTKPRDFLKGTRMSFPGLRKEADVANLIAYLAQN